MTNICSEINLHTDEFHSFVCFIIFKFSSMMNGEILINLNPNLVLDGYFRVYSKAKNMRGFENQLFMRKEVDWEF